MTIMMRMMKVITMMTIIMKMIRMMTLMITIIVQANAPLETLVQFPAGLSKALVATRGEMFTLGIIFGGQGKRSTICACVAKKETFSLLSPQLTAQSPEPSRTLGETGQS